VTALKLPCRFPPNTVAQRPVWGYSRAMTPRAVMTAILLVLAFVNLDLGHWAIGFSLIAVAAAGAVLGRSRTTDRRQ
jgi:hypothetical protein